MAGKSDIKVVERIFSDLKSYSIDYFFRINWNTHRGRSLCDSYLTQMQKRKMKRKSCHGRLQYELTVSKKQNLSSEIEPCDFHSDHSDKKTV